MQDNLVAEPSIAPVLSRSFPPITRHTLALYCGASGDGNPIHVDLDYARSAGFPDVFAHGMLVMAYLGLMLEEAGPPEGILEFTTRFVAITQLGAAIRCEAHIREKTDDRILLDLIAADESGDIKLQGRALLDRQSWETRFG